MIVTTGWGPTTGSSCGLDAASPPQPIPTATISKTAAEMTWRFRIPLIDRI